MSEDKVTQRSNPVRRYGIRGAVISRWEREGKPRWNLKQTIVACREADEFYRMGGLNPAPKFREAIERGDEAYIEWWVKGCRFPWLEERKKEGKG